MDFFKDIVTIAPKRVNWIFSNKTHLCASLTTVPKCFWQLMVRESLFQSCSSLGLMLFLRILFPHMKGKISFYTEISGNALYSVVE